MLYPLYLNISVSLSPTHLPLPPTCRDYTLAAPILFFLKNPGQGNCVKKPPSFLSKSQEEKAKHTTAIFGKNLAFWILTGVQ
jgi:hypothetical protein